MKKGGMENEVTCREIDVKCCLPVPMLTITKKMEWNQIYQQPLSVSRLSIIVFKN